MSETSRTDRAAEDNRYHECWGSACCVSVDFARQLERELKNAREIVAKYEDRYFEAKEQRDKALCERESTEKEVDSMLERAIRSEEQRDRLERELDEEREKLADWENSAAHVEADHPDEVHCSCVPILRKLLCDARLERDEAVNNYETAVLREHRMQEQRDRLEALVGHVRGMLPIPVRNVFDITPEEHSHEIGNAIEAIEHQRDRLAEALREIAEGSPWGRRNAIWLAEQALAAVEGGQS